MSLDRSRQTRHAAHAIQTSQRAAKLIADVAGIDDFDRAMIALEVVVAGIVQRLTPTEAGDLLAQLPSEIRERITAGVPAGPEPGLTRETIESELARRLDLELSEASKLLPRMGTVLQHLVSEGEMAHVRAQLPQEFWSIFPGEVAHRTP